MAWTPEQQLAIDKSGTNIIVSAGAGSGKTAVLTARTMRIITSGTHVNELLILTFTKAAAGEMKERIRKAIKKAIPEHPELSKELELIDQAYITTFDSFALSIVKKYHYLLNISNDIGISDSSIIDMQKVKIMDRVFDQYYENPTNEFKKLIYDFCIKDDKDLKKCILKIASQIDSLPNRDEYLNNYIDNFFNKPYIDTCIHEYELVLIEKVKEIDKLTYKLSTYTDGTYTEKLMNHFMPLIKSESIDEIFKCVNSMERMPLLPKGSDDETKKIRTNLKSALDNLKEIVNNHGNKNTILETLPAIKGYTSIIVEILKKFLYELHAYKELNNIYDFQDIALLSIKVLRENENVCDELKETFKEIMIDEYQDTNDIQETFISMIENNNVYCVGDIKQSIYRFRNANPYIFKNKYDKYALGKNGYKIDLVKNFRSRKEVLSNINEVFNLIMDNALGGAEYHESHQMVYGNTSYVEEGKTNYNYDFQILEYKIDEEKKYSNAEIEIFTIAKDIKNKLESKYQVFDKDNKVLRDITYNDFVILMDRTTDFDLYKKIFEYVGIPLTLYKDDSLNNSNDIYIIKNIVDYLIKLQKKEFDTKFKYDYISIARSYLFELSDQEIFNSFKNNDFTNNIIYETFNDLSSEITSSTITTILERIIEKTNMYEKLIKVGDIEASIIRISKLLDISTNLSDLGYDIYTFSNYLNELLEDDYNMKYNSIKTGSDSVKIMTIHKSKGLEYHICYYSGLYKSFNISDLKDRFLYDNKYGIITPYFQEGINESFVKQLVKYHYIEEEISEKIRLFYVALTRAKETMIILTPHVEEEIYDLDENNTIDITIRRKYRSFSDMMNSIKHKLYKYYKVVNREELNLSKNYLYTNQTLNKLKSSPKYEFKVIPIQVTTQEAITKEHFSKNTHELITKEITDNMKLGLMFHETLEYIDFKNPQYELIENNFIKNKVKKFLSLRLLQDIKNATIFKEYEFIYNNDNKEYHGIIDLMIEYENRIDIIDYKLSNIKDDNYLAQLNGYKKYISTISNKEITIYLYSILGEKIEKI